MLEPSTKLIGLPSQIAALLKFARRFGQLQDSRIYAASSHPERLKNLGRRLQKIGFLTIQICHCRIHANHRYKSDVDTRITIDLVNAANQRQIDTVILASGDSDFLPLIEYLQCQQIKVIIIGPEGATAPEMIGWSDDFYGTNTIEGLHSSPNFLSEKLFEDKEII